MENKSLNPIQDGGREGEWVAAKPPPPPPPISFSTVTSTNIENYPPKLSDI